MYKIHIQLVAFMGSYYNSQTMWFNSLIIGRQNVPITFIHSEAQLS